MTRLVGPSGALDVWFGAQDDHAALEAEVRGVSAQGLRGYSDLALALGQVAQRHKLEVRVIPRTDARGPSVLVLFGPRTYRPKR